jgi:hypothetical protein
MSETVGDEYGRALRATPQYKKLRRRLLAARRRQEIQDAVAVVRGPSQRVCKSKGK